MKSAVIFDCEFLCLEGSQRRFWCAAIDPDPVIAQVGATRIALEDGYEIIDTFRAYVTPLDRHGRRYGLDAFFIQLTDISEEDIDREGQTLAEALGAFDRFAHGARCWSWGKDELNMLAISCYVAGVIPPIPAARFDNAVKLVLAAGMPVEDIGRTPSNKLVEYFGVAHPPLRGHDALDDALSVTYAVQHLLRTGKLSADVFDRL
ncbi:MAG: exonuclease domain-containing protein [Devosia sp.]|nr:exonuclease domain-containing protein [Devosia sp.]